MTIEAFKKEVTSKLCQLNKDNLIKAINYANEHIDTGSDVIVQIGLDFLEEFMTEKEFVEFCDTL